MNTQPTGDARASTQGTESAKTGDLPAVAVGQTPRGKFIEFLKVKKLKLTDERVEIVDFVFQKHNHFDPDQLVDSMKDSGLNVSRPTVYRTLNLLVEAGLLRKLRLGSRDAYEHDYGYPHHEHLYCQKCGEVIEFVSEELQKLREEVCRGLQFRATGHKFIIEGVCSRCDKRTNSSASRRRLDMI